jgi:IclR family transcriptional regulator, KDG regulon repressor
MARSTPKEIQSLGRGLDILDYLTEADHPLGLTEIARMIDLDKSTVYRLLSTLAVRGFVLQDPDTKHYRPGMKILALSRKIINDIELRSVAKPLLKRLQQITGESVELAILADGHVIYIDGEESTATLNVNSEIGKEIPIHSTALGKALIAHLSPEEVAVLFEQKLLTRYTPRTITSLRELVLHLEGVLERGYATDDEEFNPGVHCLAAPIKDHRGKVVAAVGISGPAIRVTLDRMPELGSKVLEIAQQISHQIGHP